MLATGIDLAISFAQFAVAGFDLFEHRRAFYGMPDHTRDRRDQIADGRGEGGGARAIGATAIDQLHDPEHSILIIFEWETEHRARFIALMLALWVKFETAARG